MVYVIMVRVTPKTPVRIIGPFPERELAERYKKEVLHAFYRSTILPVEVPSKVYIGVLFYAKAYLKSLLPFSSKGRDLLKEMKSNAK